MRITRIKKIIAVLLATITAVLCTGCAIFDKNESYAGSITYDEEYKNQSGMQMVEEYAKENGIDVDEYPQNLVDLLDRNKETRDFVLGYPTDKDKHFRIDMSEYKDCDSVPLFMQWDKRWGYKIYGDDVAALTACGPTCLSMVATYLLQDTKYSPEYMMDFAVDNGYCIKGGGSLWTLISEGGTKFGLDVTEIPLDKDRVIRNLEVGNPIICVMGPGYFTKKGHFIVLTGIEDGKIKVNDPNSYRNSEKLWNFDKFSSQIRNLWVLRNLS